jgi:hypothetical protein
MRIITHLVYYDGPGISHIMCTRCNTIHHGKQGRTRFIERHGELKLCENKQKILPTLKQLAQGVKSVIDNDWHELSIEQKEIVREALRKK